MSSSVAVLFQNIGSTAGLAAAGAINRAHLSRAFAGISEDIIVRRLRPFIAVL